MLVQANEIDYDYANNRVAAVGNVQIYYGDSTLEANRVIYDQKTKRLHAEGNVRLTEQDGKVTYGEIMYHDQALIPIKTLAFDHAVNVTLGLPFVRTSPDHGTAFDIAGTGRANPASLIAALKLAARLVGASSVPVPAK